MMNNRSVGYRKVVFAMGFLCAMLGTSTHGDIVNVTVDGSDSIFLAGRTDLVIPPASDPWPGGMIRHGTPTPEEILETLPPTLAVSGGDVIKVLDPAEGGISFFRG